MEIALTSNSRARVKLEVEVLITDNWGGSATVNQIHKQAVASALGKLMNNVRGEVKVVGTPVVTMIMVDAK